MALVRAPQHDLHLPCGGMSLDVAQQLLADAEHGLGRFAVQRGQRRLDRAVHGDALALAEVACQLGQCRTQPDLAHRVAAQLVDGMTRLFEAFARGLLGTHQFLGQLLRLGRCQALEHTDLGQHRHHRMRQRIVQPARQSQPLAHHRGVARRVCQAADLLGAFGDALVELGIERAQLVALALQAGQQALERGARAVPPRRGRAALQCAVRHRG